jgi:hypothetical protein
LRSPQEDIELLDQYIKGTLSTPEIQVLELRLSQEQDLKNDLEALKALRQGMRAKALEEKMRMMKGWEEEIAKPEKNNKKWWKWGLIIFFLILLGYLLYNFALKTKGSVPEPYKTLYAAEFDKSLILHSTKRSVTVTDTLSPEQRRAYEMYSIQLFDDAIPLLEALWTNQKDTLSLFYLGVSYVGVGNVDIGLEILQKSELNKYSKQTNLFINH